MPFLAPICFSLFLTGQVKPATPKFIGPKKRAVVAAMEVKVQGVSTTAPTPSGSATVVTLDIQQPTEFGLGLSDMLVTALTESGRFLVFERQNLADVLKEQAFAATPETTAKAGKMVGAQVLVRGAVTEFTFKKSGSGVESSAGSLGSFSSTRGSSKVAIDLKVIDVETSQVLYSVRGIGEASSKNESFQIHSGDLKFGNTSFENSPLAAAVRAAIKNGVKEICRKIDATPWVGKVLDTSGSQIFVNAGATSGIVVGDRFELRLPGRLLVDPDSKEVLGATDGEVIGQCKVLSVKPGFSVAEMIGAAVATKECVVYFVPRRSS